MRENERNQEAIMRLLDELSSLADGDLTVQATVTEDITGAIADSINYAIEALRELVTTINDSAIQLDGAARQTQAAAAHMAKASSAQSRQITAASESMADMAASIEEVSGNSERCADVARHSVDIAHKGGDAVRRTIDGMNAIRETIQETSKRIKRLGESSQEIGNIVELINDIAEQTNILALNASIQASMAGEAGRGFAVVADEVQRLAERAANATKQIEVLVRTIQTDTNEAVVSMERSTTDVVGGALLAENAGAALEEIEQVSNQIASLVQNISASARQQAAASGNISKSMQVVREISTQTAEGSTATSTSIAKLAALSAQLRKSVAGFRLPDYGAGTTTLAGETVAGHAGNGSSASAGGGPRRRVAGPAIRARAVPERCARRAVPAPDSGGRVDDSDDRYQLSNLAFGREGTGGDLDRGARRARGVRGAPRSERVSREMRRSAASRRTACCVWSRCTARRCSPRRWSTSPAICSTAGERPEAPGRRARCADARHGAAAHLPRAGAVRRPRSRAGAAAAAQRSALGARQPVAVGRHAAAAQSEVRPAGAAAGAARRTSRRSPWRNGRGGCGRASRSACSGYIRGERTVQNLEILAKVAEKLEQVATTQPVFQLWWVIGAILEARARERAGGQRHAEAPARPGRPADQAALRARRGAATARIRRSIC